MVLIGGLLIIFGTASSVVAGFNYSTRYTAYWVNEWTDLRFFSLLWIILSFVMVIFGVLLVALAPSEGLPQRQVEE